MLPIQNAPALVEHYFVALQHAKTEYEDYMRRVDYEPDLEVRKAYERAAESAMERANVLKSEAEQIIKRFEEAGGTVERDPAWGAVTDWIFKPTPRR
jgi:hypothetical protein